MTENSVQIESEEISSTDGAIKQNGCLPPNPRKHPSPKLNYSLALDTYHLRSHPVFAFSPLVRDYQPHSSNIPPGRHSESNPHSPADHYR